MAGNTFGQLFRVTTAGESHGPGYVAILDGVPPGLELSDTDIQQRQIHSRGRLPPPRGGGAAGGAVPQGAGDHQPKLLPLAPEVWRHGSRTVFVSDIPAAFPRRIQERAVLRRFCHVAGMHGVEFAAADVKRLAAVVGSMRRRVTPGNPAIENGYQFQESRQGTRKGTRQGTRKGTRKGSPLYSDETLFKLVIPPRAKID